MFWDSSALIPFLVREDLSDEITIMLERDQEVVIWWATPVECVSALERRRRDGLLAGGPYNDGRRRLEVVSDSSLVIQAHPLVRHRAERLLALHPLRAGDALQLSAALVACEERPEGERLVSLDARLREAAAREGFGLVPESIDSP